MIENIPTVDKEKQKQQMKKRGARGTNHLGKTVNYLDKVNRAS